VRICLIIVNFISIIIYLIGLEFPLSTDNLLMPYRRKSHGRWTVYNSESLPRYQQNRFDLYIYLIVLVINLSGTDCASKQDLIL
jgi:hypothetical protein